MAVNQLFSLENRLTAMNKLTISLFIFLFPFLISCDDEDAWDCLRSTGDIVEQELTFDQINTIELYDNIDLVLIQGPQQEVVIQGGENIIPHLEFDFQNGRLQVSNDNKCNWVRSYSHPVLFLTVPEIDELILYGFGEVSSSGRFEQDTLTISASNYLGNLALELESNSVNVSSFEQANISLSGATNRLSLVYGGEGKFLGEDMVSQNIFINHMGINGIRVNPIEFLAVQINSRGSVCYTQRPPVLIVFDEGEGEVVACE